MVRQSLRPLASVETGTSVGKGWRATSLEFDSVESTTVSLCPRQHLLYCSAGGRSSIGLKWGLRDRKDFEKSPSYLLIPARSSIRVQLPEGQCSGLTFEFSPGELKYAESVRQPSGVVFGLNEATLQLVRLTLTELTSNLIEQPEIAEELACCLVISAARMSLRHTSNGKAIDPSLAVEEASAKIRRNVRGKHQALDGIYSVSGMSARHLQRKFRDETGMSLQEFVTVCRIDLAKDLLLDKKLALKTIAYDLGYANPSHFTRSFKAVTGITPSDYQRSIVSVDNK